MVTTVKVTGTPVLNDIITVADLKTFCRVDSADEDTLMDALRQTAISWCEQYCSIRLGDVAAIAYADAWAPLGITVGPVQSITSITYLSTANTTQTLGASYYYSDLNSQIARIRFVSPPDLYDDALNRVQVNCVIGYPEASVPKPILQAIRILVGHFYENRQQVVTGTIASAVPFAVEALLSPYRLLHP